MVKGVDLPEGKTEKDWRRWQAGMQYGIRSEQAIEKMGGHFSVVASERQSHCFAGRAVEAHQHHHPTLSSSVIQYSDGRLSVQNECILCFTVRVL